jgi:hypothetical protein
MSGPRDCHEFSKGCACHRVHADTVERRHEVSQPVSGYRRMRKQNPVPAILEYLPYRKRDGTRRELRRSRARQGMDESARPARTKFACTSLMTARPVQHGVGSKCLVSSRRRTAVSASRENRLRRSPLHSRRHPFDHFFELCDVLAKYSAIERRNLFLGLLGEAVLDLNNGVVFYSFGAPSLCALCGSLPYVVVEK